MDSKFDWCFRVSRIHFQAIHLDIFDRSKQSTFAFMINLLINIAMLYGCCYTILNYDAEIVFNVALTATGVLQVYVHRRKVRHLMSCN